MKHFTKILLGSAVLAAGLPLSSLAGNIAQYIPSYRLADSFELIDGGTVIPCAFDGRGLIFPDGEFRTAHTAQGFPIGFEFSLGGQKFTQFAVENTGGLKLGTEEDGVTCGGYNNIWFTPGFIPEHQDQFYLGMMIHSLPLPEAVISYKTIGEAGDRVLVVQFANCTPEKQTGKEIGSYDFQIRLYEKTGVVEYRFNEISSPTVNYMFCTGIHGYDEDDVLLLSAKTIGKEPVVSPFKVYTTNEGNREAVVVWNGKDDYDCYYKPVYTLTPVTDTKAPANAPADLKVSQSGSTINVTCKRAEGADATVVLYSTEPFTAADFPADGTTFPVKNALGEYITQIGNATAIYYNNADDVEAVIEGIKPATDYYIVALSANGYPAYNRSNLAEAVVSSSQAAPSLATATGINGSDIELNSEAEGNKVIIAVTENCLSTRNLDHIGVFGRPQADAKPGDELEGGGKVIYNGDEGKFVYSDARPNVMQYFSFWSVKDGRVSATASNAHAVTLPTLPYIPEIENRPTMYTIEGWTSSTMIAEYLAPFTRDGAGDRAVRFKLESNKPLELGSPELDIPDDDYVLSFEFALETSRGTSLSGTTDPITGPSVDLPLGYKAGEFGNGALKVFGGDKEIASINKYEGEMESNGQDGYVDGTSTWQKVTVPLKAGKQSIRFRPTVDDFSLLFLRNIRVENVAGVESVFEAAAKTQVFGGKGMITIIAVEDTLINIYTIDGRIAASVNAEAGVINNLELPRGMYIAEGVKVIVR